MSNLNLNLLVSSFRIPPLAEVSAPKSCRVNNRWKECSKMRIETVEAKYAGASLKCYVCVDIAADLHAERSLVQE